MARSDEAINAHLAERLAATRSLTLALAAQGARPGTLCVMPAWTFVASAHAAAMAGLTPPCTNITSLIRTRVLCPRSQAP